MAVLYVNAATGNDATSKAANSAISPWATIGRAAWGDAVLADADPAQAAAAGDTVHVAGGTYDYTGTNPYGSDARFIPLYNPVNTGSALLPIVFVADATVTLTAENWGGPAIGASGVDFIEWSGPFSMTEPDVLTTPDTGLVVLHTTEGTVLDGVFIDGGPVPGGLNDNHTGVRFEFATSCQVRNCTVQSVYAANGITDNHGAAFNFYTGSIGNLVEHNLVQDCGVVASFKDKAVGTSLGTNTFRYNRGIDVGNGLFYSLVSADPSTGNLIYQNIFANLTRTDGLSGIEIINDVGADEGLVDEQIFNNVFYDFRLAVVRINTIGAMDNVRVWNNLFWGSTNGTGGAGRLIGVDGSGSPNMPTAASGVISLEHNGYFTYVASAFCTDGAGNHTFADYKSDYGQDAAAVASVDADPDFVDAATGDFHLSPGSPVEDIGYAINGIGGPDGTTIPAGAYITGLEVIGLDDEAAVGAGGMAALVAVLC